MCEEDEGEEEGVLMAISTLSSCWLLPGKRTHEVKEWIP
jgi:hypothetical protein